MPVLRIGLIYTWYIALCKSTCFLVCQLELNKVAELFVIVSVLPLPLCLSVSQCKYEVKQLHQMLALWSLTAVHSIWKYRFLETF